MATGQVQRIDGLRVKVQRLSDAMPVLDSFFAVSIEGGKEGEGRREERRKGVSGERRKGGKEEGTREYEAGTAGAIV